jgi:hypothetical protein
MQILVLIKMGWDNFRFSLNMWFFPEVVLSPNDVITCLEESTTVLSVGPTGAVCV